MESLKIITQEKSRKICEYAFGFAYLNNRKKVTAIHKANIMYAALFQLLTHTLEREDAHFVMYDGVCDLWEEQQYLHCCDTQLSRICFPMQEAFGWPLPPGETQQ